MKNENSADAEFFIYRWVTACFYKLQALGVILGSLTSGTL